MFNYNYPNQLPNCTEQNTQSQTYTKAHRAYQIARNHLIRKQRAKTRHSFSVCSALINNSSICGHTCTHIHTHAGHKTKQHICTHEERAACVALYFFRPREIIFPPVYHIVPLWIPRWFLTPLPPRCWCVLCFRPCTIRYIASCGAESCMVKRGSLRVWI
jgi:hypothetical protein